MLDAAVEEGCTFWDSADVYGDNEDLIGKWYASFLPASSGITAEHIMYLIVWLKVQEDGKEGPDIPCYQIWFHPTKIYN